MNKSQVTGDTPLRRRFIYSLLIIGVIALTARAFDLHLVRGPYLQAEGENRAVRYTEMPSRRGSIVDRNGEILALSTPMVTVGVNPEELMEALVRSPAHQAKLKQLEQLLGEEAGQLEDKISRAIVLERKYIPLKRQLEPQLQNKIAMLQIPGLEFRRGMKRFYPEGETMASLLGFTNLDDMGQEGLELAYDEYLTGIPARFRVVQDRYGQPIRTDLREVAEPGDTLQLSIDRRLQFFAFNALKKAVDYHKAISGSAVVLDTESGEVLAMANYPTFNPNDQEQRTGDGLRNRAVTDLFEPGSTMKPFTVAAALENSILHENTLIDTAPGRLRIGSKMISEYRYKNFKTINVSTVVQKSSNVGSAKIALMMEPKQLWEMLHNVGIGEVVGSGFPGEESGVLRDYTGWRDVEQAVHSYGYGMSVTPLQLARAYSVLAEDGVLRPVWFLRNPQQVSEGEPALSEETARRVRRMLEGVTQFGGTAIAAQVDGYRVAGKTGTVDKIVGGKYSSRNHMAVFAGMGPMKNDDPKVVTVVVINDPKHDGYTGGAVSAKVFSDIMGAAFRILGIPPEKPESSPHDDPRQMMVRVGSEG